MKCGWDCGARLTGRNMRALHDMLQAAGGLRPRGPPREGASKASVGAPPCSGAHERGGCPAPGAIMPPSPRVRCARTLRNARTGPPVRPRVNHRETTKQKASSQAWMPARRESPRPGACAVHGMLGAARHLPPRGPMRKVLRVKRGRCELDLIQAPVVVETELLHHRTVAVCEPISDQPYPKSRLHPRQQLSLWHRPILTCRWSRGDRFLKAFLTQIWGKSIS
jgi:hypothetical protein